MKTKLSMLGIFAICAAAAVALSHCSPSVAPSSPSPSATNSTNAAPSAPAPLTFSQTLSADANAVASNPLIDQGAGFAAGEAIIQLANKSNPTGTAVDIYQSTSFALALDNDTPITSDQVTSLGTAYKISGDSPEYNTILTSVVNAANGYLQSKVAAGSNADEAETEIANFLEGMQLAASMSGGGPAPATATTP